MHGSSACPPRYCHRLIRHPEPEFEPTLFLSGAFQTMESWTRFAKAFAPLTTVILVDPPGMGRAAVLPPEFGVDFLARTIQQLLDDHGFDRINVIAASYGTPVAYRFAQLFPERVSRIVLAGTMKEIPSAVRDKVKRSVETAISGNRELLADQVVDGLLCRNPDLAVDRRVVAERVLRSTLARMTNIQLQQYAANTTRLLLNAPLDLRERLRGPEALVFTGEHDSFTIPARCREVADAFERAHFTTVQRADHLFHIEQFDVVSELLMRFMRSTLGDASHGCNDIEHVVHARERRCAPFSSACATIRSDTWLRDTQSSPG